jgi:hypothetical protein
VVECLGEAVVPLLRELQAEFGATRDIKIVAAGFASTCTQKVRIKRKKREGKHIIFFFLRRLFDTNLFYISDP